MNACGCIIPSPNCSCRSIVRQSFDFRYDQIIQLHERIGRLEDTIARIQHTNLRRDMNIKNRTVEIDKLCKTK